MLLSQIIGVKTSVVVALLLNTLTPAYAQNGTYHHKGPQGAYSVISIQNKGGHIKAEVFAWWNTQSGQMGDYEGTATLKNNACVLRSTLNDPECKVTLSMVQDKLKASFVGCSTDHLTDDFNGLYTKITDAVAGDYMITAPKAYFYKTPEAGTKLKAYVLKGDKVTLDIDRIAASKQNWLFVYYTNKAGKETAGYMSLSDLKRVE